MWNRIQQIPLQTDLPTDIQPQTIQENESSFTIDTQRSIDLSQLKPEQILEFYSQKLNKKIEIDAKKMGNMFECSVAFDGITISLVHETSEEKARMLAQSQALNYFQINQEIAKQISNLIEEETKQNMPQEQQNQQTQEQPQIPQLQQQVQIKQSDQQEESQISQFTFATSEISQRQNIKQEPFENEAASISENYEQIKVEVPAKQTVIQPQIQIEQGEIYQNQLKNSQSNLQEQSSTKENQNFSLPNIQTVQEDKQNINTLQQINPQIVPQYKSADIKLPSESALQRLKQYTIKTLKKLELKDEQTINGFIAYVFIDDVCLSQGIGKKKKDARQAAAENTINILIQQQGEDYFNQNINGRKKIKQTQYFMLPTLQSQVIPQNVQESTQNENQQLNQNILQQQKWPNEYQLQEENPSQENKKPYQEYHQSYRDRYHRRKKLNRHRFYNYKQQQNYYQLPDQNLIPEQAKQIFPQLDNLKFGKVEEKQKELHTIEVQTENQRLLCWGDYNNLDFWNQWCEIKSKELEIQNEQIEMINQMYKQITELQLNEIGVTKIIKIGSICSDTLRINPQLDLAVIHDPQRQQFLLNEARRNNTEIDEKLRMPMAERLKKFLIEQMPSQIMDFTNYQYYTKKNPKSNKLILLAKIEQFETNSSQYTEFTMQTIRTNFDNMHTCKYVKLVSPSSEQEFSNASDTSQIQSNIFIQFFITSQDESKNPILQH